MVARISDMKSSHKNQEFDLVVVSWKWQPPVTLSPLPQTSPLHGHTSHSQNKRGNVVWTENFSKSKKFPKIGITVFVSNDPRVSDLQGGRLIGQNWIKLNSITEPSEWSTCPNQTKPLVVLYTRKLKKPVVSLTLSLYSLLLMMLFSVRPKLSNVIWNLGLSPLVHTFTK